MEQYSPIIVLAEPGTMSPGHGDFIRSRVAAANTSQRPHFSPSSDRSRRSTFGKKSRNPSSPAEIGFVSVGTTGSFLPPHPRSQPESDATTSKRQGVEAMMDPGGGIEIYENEFQALQPAQSGQQKVRGGVERCW